MSERHEDDLFTPSLAGARARAGTGDRPWRIGSQFYVAFFGGALAAAVVGILNGRRLGLRPVRLLAMAVAGAAAYAVALGAAAVIAAAASERGARLTLVAGGVAAYLVTRRLQEDADRRYAAGLGFDDTYASLWLPGFLIVVGVGLPSGLFLVGTLGE